MIEPGLVPGSLFMHHAAAIGPCIMQDSLINTYARRNLTFEAGEGAWLIDTRGERYLDALSGIAVCGIGHANPEIARVLSEQAATLVHTSNLYRIPLQEQLAARLCALSGLERVFFCNSGAEANEAAMKLVRRYAAQNGVAEPLMVCMEGAFHGRTLATLSATANERIRSGFGPLPGGIERVPFDDLAAIERLAASRAPVAAVMVEAIQGEGGVRVPSPGYLGGLRELCSRNGWLLVLDEVQTGMGRTGKWFAYQHESVVPDIVTLAKSLGNGVPIGACLATGDVAAVMEPGSHGSTFGGNPLAARAALAVIDYIESRQLVDAAQRMGKRITAGLRRAIGAHPLVRDIRGRGLMIGVELREDCGELVSRAEEQRVLINVTASRVVRLLPPLVITGAEADRIVDVTAGIISGWHSGAAA